MFVVVIKVVVCVNYVGWFEVVNIVWVFNVKYWEDLWEIYGCVDMVSRNYC